MGNPQVPKINCYSLKFRQKLSQHFGDMSQCWGISGLHYLWVLMPREGTPTFWGSKVRWGWGLTTRKIDSCTFVANDTLGPKGREACFLGAYAERIANLTCTLSIDQWHKQQFGDMLVVDEHKREESNFFGAYRLKDGRETLGVKYSKPPLLNIVIKFRTHSLYKKIEQSLLKSYWHGDNMNWHSKCSMT